MKINGRVLYQLFKYSIYTLLTINIFVFFGEEWAAARLEYPGGISGGEIFKAYAATIDTAAWVVLLLMFELETYVLEDRHFTRAVTVSLHTLRAVCYLFIVSAFYGYVTDAAYVYQTSPLTGVSDLCALVGQNWSYATTFGEYAEISASNCTSFSTLDTFVRFDGVTAVVDQPGLAAIHFLAVVDVINAGVWLLVVLVLEIDVRLQEKNRFEGLALYLSTVAKVVLYSILALAVVAWMVTGDFVDWWDAFLWLVAFVFIELNVIEWRQESHEETA
ncbi:MAG: hypothetical protein OEV10_07160 [Gammaproteobacteria bacterium]|nr:hypothetical protein [Gammaproteobacteria bacterium]MDH3847871.1 hypothetical protein [Gammaproteobacteria bacterium]MDH3863729.1 hypothetical protein [Gammaproteobacteria bacterium]MDH3904343.1 hypothetical protein [Gammaproteobacteria bacterium]MDH3954321.1 hypothetical protein [Gammaproteobacteria bacterium]